MEYKKEQVIGFECYSIDTNGIVYTKKGKPFKTSINSHGYETVVFCINGKCTEHSVHSLVAKQFLLNPENKLTVNHIDGNKLNNNVNNLEWATYSEQMKHAFNALGRNASNIKAIYGFDKNSGELLYEFNSIMDAGRYFASKNKIDYRRSENSICRVLRGYRKSYKNCIWKYKDVFTS